MDIGGHVAALGGGPGADRRLWRISDDLGALRAQVRTFAGRAGLSGDRLDDLVLAANEAAVGVLTQGGGGLLTAGADPLGVSVDVLGGEAGPRTGLLFGPPGPGPGRGGLWLIQELCDEVSLDDLGGRLRLTMFVARR